MKKLNQKLAIFLYLEIYLNLMLKYIPELQGLSKFGWRSIITKFLVVGPFEKIRKHAIYDINGSAFACKDLIFSIPGGRGVQKRTYFRGGQEKYSLQQGGGGQNFQFFCAHTLWTTPNLKKGSFRVQNSINLSTSKIITLCCDWLVFYLDKA